MPITPEDFFSAVPLGWMIGGALVASLGGFLFWWALLGDRLAGGRKQRRCGKCWYDMSAAGGAMKCPECGKVARSEKRLHRARVRRKTMVLGAAVLLVGLGPGLWYFGVARWRTFMPDAFACYVDSFDGVFRRTQSGERQAMPTGKMERWLIRTALHNAIEHASTTGSIVSNRRRASRWSEFRAPEEEIVEAVAGLQFEQGAPVPEWALVLRSGDIEMRIVALRTLTEHADSWGKVTEALKSGDLAPELREALASQSGPESEAAVNLGLHIGVEVALSFERVKANADLVHSGRSRSTEFLMNTPLGVDVVRGYYERSPPLAIADRDQRVIEAGRVALGVVGRTTATPALAAYCKEIARELAQVATRGGSNGEAAAALLIESDWNVREFLGVALGAALAGGRLEAAQPFMKAMHFPFTPALEDRLCALAVVELRNPDSPALAVALRVLMRVKARVELLAPLLEGPPSVGQGLALYLVEHRPYTLEPEQYAALREALMRIARDVRAPRRSRATALALILHYEPPTDGLPAAGARK
ncbi:hypothetical protein BH11PLA1_BH11PLA1_22460 [soil metagenome]